MSITRVFVDYTGNPGNNGSFLPSISADGRFVTFSSDATNPVPRLGVDTISDFTNSQDTVQSVNSLTFGQLSISAATNGTLIRVASSGEVLAALTGVAPNFIGPEDFVSV
ncbi:hypothetical protein QUB05_26125 [Microcoleus sp. F10-C6]|uniref:hypothetical protein n=1 Tax=unclassified Microcoleus TaxID=2642155 RepID=UPI002FD3ACA1